MEAPPQQQDLCERVLRVWLTRLPAMPESWLPVRADDVHVDTELQPPVPPRVLAAAHGLTVQLARARAVARVATVSRACRALAEATLPVSARLALQYKSAALVGLMTTAYADRVLGVAAVQDAVVALYAAGAVPPAVRDTPAGADEATRWAAFADATVRLGRELLESVAIQLAERGMARAALPFGQFLPPVDEAALRQAQVARFMALLTGAYGTAHA